MEYKKSKSTIFCQISCHYIVIYQMEKVQYFNNKDVITLMRTKKGQKVDWAYIIFNNFCNELDRWYKCLKDNKGHKKNTY